MKTEKELNEKIIQLTNEIREKRPELVKYIDEMPLAQPNDNDPKINEQTLKDYVVSLKNLLKKTT
ncbi:MAG: hypothetical protein ACM3P1_11005 [Candidatus Saccharibacteria bacterium]